VAGIVPKPGERKQHRPDAREALRYAVDGEFDHRGAAWYRNAPTPQVERIPHLQEAFSELCAISAGFS
jgi:hypothetical protein